MNREYTQRMSRRFEVQSGNAVQQIFKKCGHNNFYHFYNISIARPSSVGSGYDSAQIDNLIIDADSHLCVIVEAKRREGASYSFAKWPKQRQAIYLKENSEPPKQYYWVNPIRGDIYLEGRKQYREIRRQLSRQKEFLMKTTRNALPKVCKVCLREEKFDEVFGIIGEGNFRFILSVSDLRSGKMAGRIWSAMVKDILVVYHNPEAVRPEIEEDRIKRFIWG
jgi:hypothetical protein